MPTSNIIRGRQPTPRPRMWRNRRRCRRTSNLRVLHRMWTNITEPIPRPPTSKSRQQQLQVSYN